MEIKTLASSSKGNCYWISDQKTQLLLECGIRFKEIQKALDFKLSSVAGCLISHEHTDHSRAANDILKAGIDVYASTGTIHALDLSGHRLPLMLESLNKFQIGTWAVLPFDIKHDSAKPLGFLLANKDGEKLLYASDTPYIRHRFKGLSHIMIEANYSSEILSESVIKGITPRAVRSRVIQSHFSLKNLKQFLRVTDLSAVQQIWLLHMSDNNANAKEFKGEIQALTGKEVYVA